MKEDPSRERRALPCAIAFVWQRFLPVHRARMRRLERDLGPEGYRIRGIEVASRDDSYAMIGSGQPGGYDHVCCFPGRNYHSLTAGEVGRGVAGELARLRPDVVFAPATAFPEGMAAYRWRMLSGGRAFMMDDAWEHTDGSGSLTRAVKRLIHRNVDGAFIPAPPHAAYYRSLGFPEERLAWGVDAVDDRLFVEGAAEARRDIRRTREELGLPERYFLFVGRLLPRKGIDVLLEAYRGYRRDAAEGAWGLVIVGSGPEASRLEARAGGEGIVAAGAREEASLVRYYAAARALVVPSLADPWAMVVNEGMACGLPVLVSGGCGSARAMVREGENGWTFAPGDAGELSRLMTRLARLPEDGRFLMGKRAQETAARWGLDAFVAGVRAALEIPRRPPAGPLSDLLARFWRGRVRPC